MSLDAADTSVRATGVREVRLLEFMRIGLLVALFCDGIPEPHAQIEEIRTAVVLRDSIGAAQAAYGKYKRPGHPRPAEFESRTGFHIVGPIEILGVANDIVVPKKLALERA